MIINATITRAMLSAQTTESSLLFILTHLCGSPDATSSDMNDTKRILASNDPLSTLWQCGCHLVVSEDERWFISPFGDTVRLAYQHKVRGSWITFGIDLFDPEESESVLLAIRRRLRTGFPADELEVNCGIKGYLEESYEVNGTGLWSVGRIILALHPTSPFRFAALERLYEIAKFHKNYADIVDDVGINHDRNYLNNIVDGKWMVEEKDAQAVLNSYFTSMLKLFFDRGFYYQDTIDGGRIDVRSNEGSYYLIGGNATVNTINITYLSANKIEISNGEWEFAWDCNNTEYFPIENPVDALLGFHKRVGQEHIYMASGLGTSLEDIHKVQHTLK